MARFDMADVAALGNGPSSADTFYRLGMMYSVGTGVPVDLITAHKWFNLAALRGHADAAALRREVAEQMTVPEISAAQRAARSWLQAN